MLSDGQVANQTTFNNAFVSRTDDTSTVGRVDLLNADTESGPDVENIQRELNGVAKFTGRTVGDAFDALPGWANTDVGTSDDDLQERGDALTERFNGTTGHTHTGGAGQGGPINTSSLESDNTTSTDKDTGCLVLNGGLGVEENINAGGTITATASVTGSNLSGTNTGDDPMVVTGSRASPTNVTAAGGVVAPTRRRTLAFIKGNTAGVDLSANPQVAAGVNIGDEYFLRVPAGQNGIYFENGNGLSLNGDFTLGVDVFCAHLVWDGTEWFGVNV